MDKKNRIDSLYSAKKNPDFEKYMSLLFPHGEEEFTNFGYWKNLMFPKSINDIEIRIDSQKKLYELVFSLLNIRSNEKILEIGCGKGYGVKNLCEKGILCFGIDALDDQIKSCKLRHRKFKDRFIQGRAELLPFNGNYFNSIYSIEAAQHFPNFQKFCDEIKRVLIKNGKFCITTFFLCSEKSRSDIDKIIPPTVEGTDKIISIDFAHKCLNNSEFDSVRIDKIGNHIFPYFAKWQKLVIQALNYPNPPKDKLKWARYFSDNKSDKPHPWLEAYQRELIDYFIITNF